MSNQPLLTPYRMGDLDLPNRIVMAPLTRMRAQPHDHVPTTLQAEYYAQRASAGLIITEATAISPEGFGWADTPGLWTGGAGPRMATCYGCRPCCRRSHHCTALAHRRDLASRTTGRRAASVRIERRSRPDLGHADGKEADGDTAASDEEGDSSYGCRFRARCAKRDGSRLRWCPDPRQLSLSDLAVSERRHQPAQRRIRRKPGKSLALSLRSSRVGPE